MPKSGTNWQHKFRTDLHSSLILSADHNKQKPTERDECLNGLEACHN